MSSNDLEIMIESFKHAHSKTKNDGIDSIATALHYLSYYESMNESDLIMEQSTTNFYTERAINIIKESIIKENTFTWPYSIAPYFTPEEISEFAGYYSEASRCFDNKSIFHNIETLEDELRNTEDPNEIAAIKAELDALGSYSGEAEEVYNEATATQFEPRSWNKKVTTLITQLRTEENPEQIDSIKQALIDLGWNPEIDYTTENQIKAKKRIESIYQERYNNIFSLDLTSLVETADINDEITNEDTNDDIKPIHVVVVKGDTAFADVISKATNSQFSHSAICIDNDFNNLYSFNLTNGVNRTGGFSIERIDNYPKENRLAVFSFFVSKDDHKKISERIKMLTNNIGKTAYSAINILLLPFKRINFNFSNSMICSQFVDSILKMAHIDITGKDSSHVVPNDFYKAANSTSAKGKIYKVFDGITKKFNSKKIVKYTNKMAKKVKPVTEASTLLTDFIYPTIIEAKLPVEFNNDGDVLITNKFVDFDREYSASHKLLLQYAKTGNTESMKYELARLYYINYILERRLYNNKFLSNKEKNIKTRARVLNDFNKYIEYVLKREPNFNFSEYYEKSIFYPHTIEIKKSTMLKLKDIIKYIL